MKKILLIFIALFVLCGCETKEEKKDEVDNFAIIDKKFSESNLNYSKNVQLNQDNYYAKEAYQYTIDDASCIVDIYYFGEDSDIYKDAYSKQAIRAREYDNKYIVATVNAGFGTIIWDGCNKKEEIESILKEL